MDGDVVSVGESDSSVQENFVGVNADFEAGIRMFRPTLIGAEIQGGFQFFHSMTFTPSLV